MKFLFVPTKNSIYDIPWAIQEMGHEVNILDIIPFDPNTADEEQNQALDSALSSNPCDFVISYLFIPSVSDICARFHIRYISWTYDSPLAALFSDAVFHPTNYTFIFDQAECQHLRDLNAPHIWHMPLAVNLNRTGALDITAEDEQKYSHDISFIGGLYEENAYNSLIGYFPEHLQVRQKLYLMQNMCHWEKTRPWPAFPSECTEFMMQTLGTTGWNTTTLMDNDTYFGLLIYPRKLAELERITVLNTLAQDFSLDLYTKSNSPHLQGVTVHSGVDYYTDMNKIFYLSRINLNISLSSIETGIPQRVLDIMGCGGFVLTDYREEIEEYFEIGKEIEVFRSIEELKEKCAYYLTHEKERLTIAMNGYKKIRDHFTYPVMLERMLKLIQEETL